MNYKIFYAISLVCITLTNTAAHRTGKQHRPFFYFETKEPQFSGCNEIVVGPRESLIYAFHAEHEDTALFLNENLKNSIKAYLHQPIVITQELCTIMQKLLTSFLKKQEDPFNVELQKVAITFLHPLRNNVSVHHIECDQGTFKQVDVINYENICTDPKRLFISMLAHKDIASDLLSAKLAHIENNALTKIAAAKHPNKLLAKLLLEDNHVKGLIALSGYRWLKKTHPTFTTQEYQQLAKKFYARQQGRRYRTVTPIEESILTYAQHSRAQLLAFAAQLRADNRNPTPQFALDFLDDAIEQKRQEEAHEQQTAYLIRFINLIP